jgi:uncharacterized membrane protein HdeD (DUF308 family)
MAPNIDHSSNHSDERAELQKNWYWLVILGVALTLLGAACIMAPVAATIKTVEIFGILLLIGAGFELASGLWVRCWRGFFLHLLMAIFYFFVGIIALERPGLGAAAYTLMLAMFFIAAGAIRAVAAAAHRFPGWGWVLLNGVVCFALGIMIWRNMPEAAFWVIGTFIGIDLVFNGVSWIMLGLSARSTAPVTVAPPTTSQPVGV